MTYHSEIIKLRVNKQDLLDSNLDSYEIIAVDQEWDYSQDELWQVLYKESRTAYKKLKAREFNLRHNDSR